MEINRFRKRQFYKAYVKKNRATKVHYGDDKFGEYISVDLRTVERGSNFRICAIENNIDIPYFTILNSHFISYDSKICRISMLEPVYMDSKYNSMVLTQEQCDELYNIFTKNDNEIWKKLIQYTNFENDTEYDLDLPVPDYRKLSKQS